MGFVSSVSRAKYDFENEFDEYISSILFLSTIVLGLFVFFGYIFRESLGMMLGVSSSIIIVLFMNCFFMYVIELISTKFTIDKKYKSYVFVSVTSALATVLLSITIILNMSTDKYLGRIFGGFIITGIFATVITLNIFKNGRKFINKDYWIYGLKIGLPIIPHTLSGIILMQVDRIMINHYIGVSATGIYSFAYNMGIILSVFYSATNKAWVPWFFDKMEEKNYAEIREKIKYYIIIFTVITFLLIFITPEIVAIMASKEYKSGTGIVPIIMLSNFFIFLYTLPVNLEFYMKKTHYISIGTLASGVINIILNFIFIPKFGAVAGAWTTLVSYIVLFLYHYTIANKIAKAKIFPIKYFIGSILVVSTLGAVYYVVASFLVIRYILIAIVLTTFVLVLKYRYKLI